MSMYMYYDKFMIIINYIQNISIIFMCYDKYTNIIAVLIVYEIYVCIMIIINYIYVILCLIHEYNRFY